MLAVFRPAYVDDSFAYCPSNVSRRYEDLAELFGTVQESAKKVEEEQQRTIRLSSWFGRVQRPRLYTFLGLLTVVDVLRQRSLVIQDYGVSWLERQNCRVQCEADTHTCEGEPSSTDRHAVGTCSLCNNVT